MVHDTMARSVKKHTSSALFLPWLCIPQRAVCDDLETYLTVPSPMTGDMTITLDVDTIECPTLDGELNGWEVEEIIVEGGTLTIASDSTVQ